MSANIPDTGKKRIVIAGGGFAGMQLSNKLKDSNFQLVLIDKVNYHQFQPLLYQVATSGLEPSSISFPFRKDFQGTKDFHFRLATIEKIESGQNRIITSIGTITYDYLVIATGTDTNYFSMENIYRYSLPMKSVSEALALRNHLLLNLERALTTSDPEKRQALLNIVIVGGGATGVEVAGAIAEMKRYILKKDYPELNVNDVNIILLEGAPKLLRNMSESASEKSYLFLEQMGVKIMLNATVTDYIDYQVKLADGTSIPTRTLIWVSGVTGKQIEGIPEGVYGRGNRIQCNGFNQVEGFKNIFAIGDICLQTEKGYETGYPQVAQVAIQQGRLLAKNLERMEAGKEPMPFRYHDKGTLSTIGRNRAVADIRGIKFQGIFAWMIWMLVHLMSILGVKNKIQIFINWLWNYITYDQSLRLIIRPEEKEKPKP